MNVLNYKIFFLFILFSIQITYGQNQNCVKNENNILCKSLIIKTDLYVEALRNNDFNKFVEMTHPVAVEKAGGKEKLVKLMTQVFEENPKLFKSSLISIEKPAELIKSEGKLFGVVPLKIEGITHTDRKIITIGCFVGVSDNNGKNWTFVSGEGFDELFPSSKGKLKIIVQKTSIDGVEQ